MNSPAETRHERALNGDRPPRLSEYDFRLQIVGPKGLATILGWLHVGFRPAMTTRGWRTPGTGELAKGWPDLVLVHPRLRRLVFAELKADDGALSPEQTIVLDTLRALATAPGDPLYCPRIDVVVWRPRDMESREIERVLR